MWINHANKRQRRKYVFSILTSKMKMRIIMNFNWKFISSIKNMWWEMLIKFLIRILYCIIWWITLSAFIQFLSMLSNQILRLALFYIHFTATVLSYFLAHSSSFTLFVITEVFEIQNVFFFFFTNDTFFM